MNCVSTGSDDLDKWLCGGYERGIVTMIVGPPASGKSNFAVLAACSCARSGKVIFVDTEGGFSIERVKQIVGDSYENVLSNIMIFSPTDFSEQKGSFEKLNSYLKKGNVSMVIVDSIAMLYRLERGGANDERVSEINYSISTQMKDLVAIARKRDIPVLVTNQVYFEFLKEFDLGSPRKMGIVGGDVFRYWSKCIIELRSRGGRSAKLLKHRSLGDREFDFEIRDAGIFKRRGMF